jgi:hypothetical protein
MSPSSRFAFALAATVGLASPALASKDAPPDQLAKITEGRVAGAPQNCISLPQVYGMQIIEKKTIAYRIGSTWYVNQLRSGAESLNSDDVLVTRTFGSQLCSLDTVKLVDRFAGGLRGFVVLGPFTPYKLADKKN